MNLGSEVIRDRGALVAAMAEGLRPVYLFFWGHRVPVGGMVTENCLSQWYSATFEIAGVSYRSAEHFMMAAKARLFDDGDLEEQIRSAPSPSAAKTLGRRVKNFDEKTWRNHRFEAVVEGSVAKFGQNQELGDYLESTGSRILVEASPVDRIWGIGLAADHADADRPGKWPGQNLLGFALMEARRRLRESNN